MDSNRLCNHLSRLLTGKVAQSDINAFVDRCIKIDRSCHFVPAMKSLSLFFKYWQSGDPDAFRHCQEYFGQRNILYPGTEYGGPKSPGQYPIPNSDFINNLIIYCARNPQESDYLFSGVMKLHSVKIWDSPSQSDCDKIRATICSPGPDVPSCLEQDFRELCQRSVGIYSKMNGVRDRSYMSIFSHPANPNKMSYSPAAGKSLPRDNLSNYGLVRFLHHKDVWPLWANYPDEFSSALLTEEESKAYWNYFLENQWDGPLGSISVIPELGGKFRTVAVPCIGLLSLNYPLSQILHRIIKRTKTQGVSDHSGTAYELQGKMDGRTFHSMDMSSFTDRYPYLFQRILLEELQDQGIILPFDLDVQDLVCSAKFDFRREPVSYTVGTPQGSYGSFPLASLTHGLLATLSYEQAHCERVNPLKDLPFRVIGDDIVIYDDGTYDVYVKHMTSLGVDISFDKSLNSSEYIEMCSKWISPRGVFLQKKIKPIESGGAYKEAFTYYKGTLETIPEYLYLHHLPEPFGVLEENEGDVCSQLSKLASVYSMCTSFMTRNDYKILSDRRPPEYLVRITEVMRSHKELVNLTPMQLSRVNEIPNILKDVDKLIEESDLQSIEDLSRDTYLTSLYKEIDIVINQINKCGQFDTGPHVPNRISNSIEIESRSDMIGKLRLEASLNKQRSSFNERSKKGETPSP